METPGLPSILNCLNYMRESALKAVKAEQC